MRVECTHVTNIFAYSILGIQKQLSIPKITEDKFVVLLSGLELSKSNDLTTLQLFVDYLGGFIGGNKEIEKVSIKMP